VITEFVNLAATVSIMLCQQVGGMTFLAKENYPAYPRYRLRGRC